VLLVDDDPALLRRLSGWLEGAGYTVAAAVDAAGALASIDAQVPDFLIADAEMPHLSGWELWRRVRERPLSQYVYIMLLAAGPQQVLAADGCDGGADDVLGKPVAQGELLARLRSGRRVLDLERRLCQAEGVDPLTGLMTRHAFHEVLAREWHRASRYGSPLSCVMMDLDFFKRINDVYGHSAGDAVLRATAAVLLANCRRSDYVCRYGGEEFCILLPETDDRSAAAWAQRARRRLAAAAIAVAEVEVRMTASFGTAGRHDDTAGPEHLVDMADQALLCAKQSGRDCTVRYESLTDAHELEPINPRSREALFRGIVARDVMNPLSVFLRESESIGQAADLFLRRRINSAAVLDGQGRLAGVLSEKDLLAAMTSLDCWRQPIREVMKRNVICYEEDAPILAVYDFLCRVSIRRVVITSGGRPVGTISRGTLLGWFRHLLGNRPWDDRSFEMMELADDLPGLGGAVDEAEQL
jgi:diguanylate cyclase (GGDEF)-like protein